ncbi:MAG: PAS domain S-box protein [Eisenbergiella sp.]
MDTENRERDYEYTTLMNMLHVSVSKHLLNEQFSLVWANDFYYELIGYTKEEYEAVYHNQCNSSYSNDELGIHDEEDWNLLGQAVTKALSEGKSGFSMIGRMRRKDGDYILVQMSATFVDDYIDGYQVSYTAMTDVTDLVMQQREQSVTYDNLPGFVAKCRIGQNMEMTLLSANTRFYDFFGENTGNSGEENPLFLKNLKQNEEVMYAHKRSLPKENRCILWCV